MDELTVVYFPSKIGWDLTNGLLSKLLKLSHVLGSVQWVLLEISWILPKKNATHGNFFTESFYSDFGSKAQDTRRLQKKRTSKGYLEVQDTGCNWLYVGL